MVQNEPGVSDTTYPSCTLTSQVAADVATQLRTMLDNSYFPDTKIIGYEHNWDNLGKWYCQVRPIILCI
jgi:glucan endo-1,6-beta-glucosidase